MIRPYYPVNYPCVRVSARCPPGEITLGLDGESWTDEDQTECVLEPVEDPVFRMSCIRNPSIVLPTLCPGTDDSAALQVVLKGRVSSLFVLVVTTNTIIISKELFLCHKSWICEKRLRCVVLLPLIPIPSPDIN